MKGRIGFVTALCICSVCLYSGCLSSIVPTQYGEWEGNYVYRANGRATTTGEAFETLVKQVEIDGETLDVTNCLSYDFLQEDMYMVLSCKGKTKDDVAQNCLVKYNVKNKTQTLICDDFTQQVDGEEFSYQLMEIACLNEEDLYVFGYQSSISAQGNTAMEKIVIRLSCQGEILGVIQDVFTEWEQVSAQCFLRHEWSFETREHTLYVRDGFYAEPILVQQWAGENEYYYNWKYVEKNGVRGILLCYYQQSAQETDQLKSISFFNLADHTLCEVAKINNHSSWFGEEYIKTFSYTQTTYKKGYLTEEIATSVQTDNTLYRLHYTQSGVRLEKVLDFAKSCDVFIYDIAGEKLLYRTSWWESARGCQEGGKRHHYYEYDFSTGGQTLVENEDVDDISARYREENAKATGVTVGEYTYFIQEEQVATNMMLNRGTALIFKRYNKQNGEVETLQLWLEDGDAPTSEDLKYCKEFWLENLQEDRRFQVFPY